MSDFRTYIVIVVAYLLGSIPSAYLIVKLWTGKNIYKEGTGNAGAMNSFDITGKKAVGVAVFFIDFLKGAAAVGFAKGIGAEYIAVALSAVWALLGHNYSIFKGFKGGRGLATTTGALLMLNPLGVIFWALMWVTGRAIITKNVHINNTIALFGAPILLFSTPKLLIEMLNFYQFDSVTDYKVLVSVMAFIILLKHLKPLKEYFQDKLPKE